MKRRRRHRQLFNSCSPGPQKGGPKNIGERSAKGDEKGSATECTAEAVRHPVLIWPEAPAPPLAARLAEKKGEPGAPRA